MDIGETKPVSIEIPTRLFIEIVKYVGPVGVWAQPSHAQDHPCEISYSAILKWRLDEGGNLYAVRITGEKIYLNEKMPAMKLVLNWY